jgi:hypothetical protein
VTFAPTASVPSNDTIEIGYNDGAAVQTTLRNIQGTGANPGLLTISEAEPYNYGTFVNGTNNDYIFTITNAGASPTTAMSGTVLAAPFTFKGGSYPGTGGTCAGTLAQAMTCTIAVTFSPVAVGPQSSTIQINYNNGVISTSTTRGVQGTGALPGVIAISEVNPYNYSSQALGSGTDHTFILTNNGGFSASAIAGTGLAAPFTYKGGSYPGTAGTCGATLAVTVSCTIVVTFTPSVLGVHNDTIQIDYNNGVANVNSLRDVTGTGANPALLNISESDPYNYGPITQNATLDHTFTITNIGAVTATTIADGLGLAAPWTFKDGTYPGTGGTCLAALAPLGTCDIVVTFAPTTTGPLSDVIEIDYFNGVSNQTATRQIQGTGIGPAVLTISNSPIYDYGTQVNGSSTNFIFTVTNSGASSATLVGAAAGLALPYSFASGSYPGAGGTCTATIVAGGNCTIVINYAPTTVATHTGIIDLIYFDGVVTQHSLRNVTGVGVAPATLTISEAEPYSYGTVVVGTNNDRTFTVANTGGSPATAILESGLAAPYTIKGGTWPGTGGTCSTSIGAGLNCTIVVTYSPSAPGSLSDSIVLNYNNGLTAQSVSRGVTGNANLAAVIAISGVDPYSYGSITQNATFDSTFTLTNTGGVTATTLSESTLVPPYSLKGGTWPGVGGTCTTTLGAGLNCTIVVTFAPVGSGVQNGTITVGYNNGVTGVTSARTVTGTGIAPATLTITDPPLYDYLTQSIGSNTDRIFTINNTGSSTASAASTGSPAWSNCSARSTARPSLRSTPT